MAAILEGPWVEQRNTLNMVYIFKSELKRLGTCQHSFTQPVIRRLRQANLVTLVKNTYTLTPLAESLITQLEAETC